SPRPAGTHATLPATPDWLIQDRSSTVLPLPGGADTTATRACAASRPNSRGRETTPPAPRPAAPPAAASAPTADPMAQIIAPRQTKSPVCRLLTSCQSLAARAVPQSRGRARPAAPSSALVLDHRLNDHHHRRLRHAANPAE